MEKFLEGSRFTDESLERAYRVSVEELPALTEVQLKEVSGVEGAAERYARSIYAGMLAEPYWADRIERVGRIVEAELISLLPGSNVFEITLKTSRGLFQVVGDYQGRRFTFLIREQVADDLLDAGDQDALDRIQRIVQMASLPFKHEAKAS